MCRGVGRAGFEARPLPLADGGEGTLAAILDSSPGTLLTASVTGPDGDPVEADWAVLGDGTAVIEMARASGLALVERNDPLTASTAGTGELIAAAIARGCRRVIVGVGGSATVDGGLGALDALGWSLGEAEVLVACDVTTTFLAAPALFGPQKGASPADVAALEERLAELAPRLRTARGLDIVALSGSGAAGGLAGGLAAIGARLVPGFDVVAEAVGFPAALAECSAVITGEGRVDRRSGEDRARCRARRSRPCARRHEPRRQLRGGGLPRRGGCIQPDAGVARSVPLTRAAGATGPAGRSRAGRGRDARCRG